MATKERPAGGYRTHDVLPAVGAPGTALARRNGAGDQRRQVARRLRLPTARCRCPAAAKRAGVGERSRIAAIGATGRKIRHGRKRRLRRLPAAAAAFGGLRSAHAESGRAGHPKFRDPLSLI